MPPFLSNFRLRTNSLLDNITGIIPDSPSSTTSKDNSLTCRRCGNRFRDRLELSSHFNLLPHHSDYSDSHDFDSFTRPKGRRTRTLDQRLDRGKAAARDDLTSPSTTNFSESQAFYDAADKDKENVAEGRPTFLRKFPTFTALTTTTTDDLTRSPFGTDYADQDGDQSLRSPKAKGKQREVPRLPRDGSFQYGQPLASSDEEGDAPIATRSRARSATVLSTETVPSSLPRASFSSTASRSSGRSRQAPSLPPKLPAFDWQTIDKKPLPDIANEADDAASIASDSSFRTAGSTDMYSEKAQLKAMYGSDEKKSQKHDTLADPASSDTSAIPGVGHGVLRTEQGSTSASARHASESDLLLETPEAPHYDAPPSYHELHGDSDPFDDLPTSSRHRSRHLTSRSDGFATMPSSPVSRFGSHEPRRPRRATNAWSSFASESQFPVTFSSTSRYDEHDAEDDLYNPRSEKTSRPSIKSRLTEASLPPLVTSSSFSTSPSPSTPKTPMTFFDDASLVAPPLSLPRPAKPSSNSASRRNRHHSRAKSDAATPSTRCPTCFAKFSSLDKTLKHLDNSDCGAVEFESGLN